ncbi:hypothetical protein CAPTEDRAFT_208485 [Capitella teleta]|uniref:DUF4806 domain-containing protein n=1 Tax=Capitella teleta TaxID=283909 RepID=R7V8P2_CAPTE|nr:hypothetical protein CAPTEDRAFT_208485 [Capitella teleta]|eukprot:ELU12711.1 hypothetical protein CAPTEDRAFT_208485 [Capitella teleta]
MAFVSTAKHLVLLLQALFVMLLREHISSKLLDPTLQMEFLVVEFTETKEVEVIPKTWLKCNQTAYWPPLRSVTAILKAQNKASALDPKTWTQFTIRILKFFDKIEDARQSLQMASFESDLDTEIDEVTGRPVRKQRPRQESCSEEDITSPPQPAQKKKSYKNKNPTTTSTLATIINPSISSTVSESYRLASSVLLSLDDTDASQDHEMGREGFERQVLHSLAKVEVQLVTNTKEMKLLRRETSLMRMEMGRQQHPAQEDILEGVILPLNSEEELASLETRLEGEATLSKALIQEISLIGGSCVKDQVRRAMSHVLGHNVAIGYNWAGSLGWKSSTGQTKCPFQNLQIFSIIIRAVLKHPASAVDSSTTWNSK